MGQLRIQSAGLQWTHRHTHTHHVLWLAVGHSSIMSLLVHWWWPLYQRMISIISSCLVSSIIKISCWLSHFGWTKPRKARDKPCIKCTNQNKAKPMQNWQNSHGELNYLLATALDSILTALPNPTIQPTQHLSTCAFVSNTHQPPAGVHMNCPGELIGPCFLKSL